MANINLISARRAERVRLTRIARGLLTAMVVGGVISAGSVAYMLTRQVVAGQRLAQAESRLEELRPILQEIEDAEHERRALQPRLTTLVEAQQRTGHWFGIMEGLKRAIPTQTWLTNVAVERGAAQSPSLLRVNGVTSNQARVGETMFRLSQQPDYYSQVDLRYTRTARREEGVTVEFELVAQLKSEESAASRGANDAHQAN
jgi:Tfp pilus assembly protein PilN